MNEREELSFEEGFRRLEEVVDRLSSEEVSLKESFRLYEEGAKLIQFCSKLLTEFEGKVKQLSKNQGDGFTTEPFEK